MGEDAISEIEAGQSMIQQCIEASRKLAARSDALLASSRERTRDSEGQTEDA